MNQVFFVTGSSRGLGRQIVEQALAVGHRVVATARNPRDLEGLAARYGDSVHVEQLDVTDPAAAQRAVTDWAGSSMTIPPPSEPYQATVGASARAMAGFEHTANSDPRKVAQLVVAIAGVDDPAPADPRRQRRLRIRPRGMAAPHRDRREMGGPQPVR